MRITIFKFLSIFFVSFIFISTNCNKKKNDDENKASSKERFKIAGIVLQEDQFFRLVKIGMKDAAKRLNVDLLEGNSENKPDKEIQLVNTYITNKVDAIAIAPQSATSSLAALKRAFEKGIKIIIHNNNLESDIVSTTIESDHRELGVESGKAAKKYIEEKLGGNAKIAILAFKSQLPEQSNARTDGFKQEISKLPGVKIIAEQDAWLPEMAVKKAGDIITANPDVSIIWSANEGGTVGSVMAVKNLGKRNKITVFGIDISNQLIDFLLADDNILQAVAGQKPFEIGTQIIESSLKILKGEKVEKKTTMSCIILSRTEPDTVRRYKKYLNELISKDNR